MNYYDVSILNRIVMSLKQLNTDVIHMFCCRTKSTRLKMKVKKRVLDQYDHMLDIRSVFKTNLQLT